CRRNLRELQWATHREHQHEQGSAVQRERAEQRRDGGCGKRAHAMFILTSPGGVCSRFLFRNRASAQRVRNSAESGTSGGRSRSETVLAPTSGVSSASTTPKAER